MVRGSSGCRCQPFGTLPFQTWLSFGIGFARLRHPFASLNAASVSLGKVVDSTGKDCESVRWRCRTLSLL